LLEFTFSSLRAKTPMLECCHVCATGERLEKEQLYRLLVHETQGAIRRRERIRGRFYLPHGITAHHPESNEHYGEAV
jgi:hypothetical protein